MELVRNSGLSQSLAFEAYKKKTSFPTLSLEIAEQEEINHENTSGA
jgi:hypothetical protein